jgi:hypothetical protein
MRREIVILRAELEEMRVIADEARKTNRVLYAYMDDILENQYQWQREAERLSSLLKKKFNNRHRFLFSWGKHARQNDGLSQPSLALTPSCADPLGGNLRSKGHKIMCHERLVNTLRRLILWISFCWPPRWRTPALQLVTKPPAAATH